MDRLTIGGQLSAKHSVASLLLSLFDGRPPSDSSDTKLHIPLVQDQIADLLGLSTVHVNRVIVALEAEGLIRREGNKLHTYELTDVPQLKSLIGMAQRVRRRNPIWLPVADG